MVDSYVAFWVQCNTVFHFTSRVVVVFKLENLTVNSLFHILDIYLMCLFTPTFNIVNQIHQILQQEIQ